MCVCVCGGGGGLSTCMYCVFDSSLRSTYNIEMLICLAVFGSILIELNSLT